MKHYQYKPTFTICFIILGLILLFGGCEIIERGEKGNGVSVTSVRPIETFDQVTIDGNYRITLIASERNRLEIEADENLQEYIITSVSNQQLRIETTDKIASLNGFNIDIYYSEPLKTIKCNGAAVINNSEPLKVRNLQLEMSGAGMIDLEIEGRSLATEISGAGLVKISGKIKNQKLDLSGAGSYKAYDLYSENCELDLSGFGNAQVFAANRIDVDLSGLGNVSIRGEPTTVNKSISGLGKVRVIRPGETDNTESENYL